MIDQDNVKKGIVLTIILGIFILVFFVLKPIIISIILGLMFAYIFNPVYKKIKTKIGGTNRPAIILILGIIIIIAVPMVYLTPLLVNQIFETYVSFQGLDFNKIIGQFVKSDMASTIAINLDNIIGKFFSSLLSQFTALVINLPSVLLQFAVFLFTFYFTIRDSEELTKYLKTLSPFSKSTGKKFFKEFRGITNAIVFGQLLIGIIQGIAVGIGLFLLGVPKPLLLTFIACLVSIIPVMGSWFVWLPAGIYLLLAGETFSGIFLILYGAIFVSTLDNLLRPYFLSKQSNLPVVLSIIGTIGGLYFFGITGLILGPLIIAYALIIIDFYQQGKLKELFNNR